jgi:formate/nitrite transporter FocA (FNT family)
VWLVDETLLFQGGAPAGIANAIAVAKAKTSASFGTTVVRGLLCNWLVRITSPSAATHCDVAHKFSAAFRPGLHCECSALPFDGQEV